MGVTKKVIKDGNGQDYPRSGDKVTIEYTGNLYDGEAGADKHYRGKQYVHWRLHYHNSLGKETLLINAFLCLRFDSSKGRGDFETAIGVGKVIKGTVDL